MGKNFKSPKGANEQRETVYSKEGIDFLRLSLKDDLPLKTGK